MSNDPQKTEPKRPGPPEPIPVRIARFTQQLEVPGKSFTSSVTSEPAKRGVHAWWEITYHRDLRHHRITWHEPGEGKALRSVMVPDCLVYWEPF